MALSVATYMGVTALVRAGPEPTTSTPGLPLAQPQAEAAKPAETSWRQLTTVRPSRSIAAMTSIMGPATTPKAVSIPAAFSCRAMICPPLISATPRLLCAPPSYAPRGEGRAVARGAYNRVPPPRAREALMDRLTGKVALVTGAGSGIGRASALRLDVSEEAAVKAAREQTARELGGFDVLMNNAGIGRAAWDATIAVNLSGVYYGLLHGGGAAGEAGRWGSREHGLDRGAGGARERARDGVSARGRGGGAYIAAKHGVVGLTRQFALIYANHGVRVNAIAPGYIRTPLLGETLADAEAVARLEELHPLGRLGEPEEIAAGGGLPRERRRVVRHGRDLAGGQRLHGALRDARAELVRSNALIVACAPIDEGDAFACEHGFRVAGVGWIRPPELRAGRPSLLRTRQALGGTQGKP